MHPLDLLFPKHCLGCGRIGRYICPVCRETIVYIRESEQTCPVCRRQAFLGRTHLPCRGRGLDGLVSFFQYRGIVKKAIRSVKFGRVSDLISELMQLIPLTSYNIISDMSGNADASLIPIPLYLFRKRFRGFNQSDYIADQFAKMLGKPVRPEVLVRVKATRPQAEEASRESRLVNIRGAFRVRKEVVTKLRIQSAILVDDVATSGATMNEAAKTLKSAGVRQVFGVSLAR